MLLYYGSNVHLWNDENVLELYNVADYPTLAKYQIRQSYTVFLFWFCKTGFICVSLDVLDLTL